MLHGVSGLRWRANHLVSREGGAPFVEVQVRRQDRGRSLVALSNQVVEILVLGRSERFQPKVIDDEQRHLAEVLQAPFVRAHGLRGAQACMSWVWVMNSTS